MKDLKSILKSVLKATPNYQENMARIEIYEAWPKVVGEKVAKHAWPVKMVEDGALLVAAESSVWLQSLRFLEPQIIEKFAKELGSKKVKSLRYKMETKNWRSE
jgi:predicted nucleic acid-binding Zn ribbon protein